MNIHVWEFNYYSKDLEEQTNCYYYTHTDENYIAIQTFLEDEGQDTEYWVSLDDVITKDELLSHHGDYTLVLDR